ncbi:MAG: NADH-ubiquinone oxidoreductase [Proteobacteria bacterium]|nr:NADH-ubiquinone oxidoreductase [Pseudomonadota bacterium]MBU6425559.1 NADH-ubiquinone oxidoreductase [Rhodospirillales bacterium]
MTAKDQVFVIGAGGRSGAALCRALLVRGFAVVPVLRNVARLPADIAARALPPRIADLTGPESLLRAALEGAGYVISTAHASHIPALLQATTAETVLIGLGSTRKFTRWPDKHGNGVLRGEKALLESGRPGMLLHPTMIYGAEGENNVQRLAALLRRLPVVPLPNGGRALVQPIHQDDVTRSLLAALDLARDGMLANPKTLVIAGPHSMEYRDFAGAVARAAGFKMPPVIPVPASLLAAALPVMRLLPRMPKIGRDEIRRLLEDKDFDIGPMEKTLSVTPRSLEDGLRSLFT